MAPLSVLPGRLRFETNSLIGSKEGCLLLEESIFSVQGVCEASANHRTGRVLVKFDESLITRCEIEKVLDMALRTVAMQKNKEPEISPVRRIAPSRKAPSSGVAEFMMEIALHAFLPSPLDLLLPTAATMFRR